MKTLRKLSTPNPVKAVSIGQRMSLLKDLALTMACEMDSIRLLAEMGQMNGLEKRQGADGKRGIDIYNELRRYEIELISHALRITQGQQARGSRLLGIKSTTLNAKINRYAIRL